MTDIFLRLAVCGAHMDGLALNHQLLSHHAVLDCATYTMPEYKLYLSDALTPPRPGMVRCSSDGTSIALEVWRMPVTEFGSFIQLVKAPLCIGWVHLESGDSVLGFLCESIACSSARDISA